MKRFLILVTLFFLSTVAAFAQTAPNWVWAVSAGSIGTDRGNAIATDSSGNTYVTGSFMYQASFGATTLTGGGGSDIFVAKMNSNGYWIWAIKVSSSSTDYAEDIHVDGYGDIYVTGCFSSNVYFGSTYLSSAGDRDVFVAKLNSDGVWQWAKRAGGTRIDLGYDVCTDNSGNTFITGFFSGTAVFGTTSLVAGVQDEIFVSKLDSSGNWLWAKRAGSTGYDYGYGISTDYWGNCYITGGFNGSALFGIIELIGSGADDAYVAKLNSSGDWLWAVAAGGTETDFCYGSITDSSDRTIVTGSFSGSASFGSIELTSNGYDDIFVAQIASDGTWLWVKNAGGEGSDYGWGVALDSEENCYITGFFESVSYFGDTTLTCNGVTDVFAAKLDHSGNWLWAKNAGGTSQTEGFGISTDTAGNCFVTGKFDSTAYFGTSPVYSTSGSSDIFVARLSSESTGSGIPMTPQNPAVYIQGEDVIFAWDAVTEDIDGQPLTPDYYQVESYGEPYGEFLPLVQVSANFWVNFGGIYQSPVFYRVRAVVTDK